MATKTKTPTKKPIRKQQTPVSLWQRHKKIWLWLIGIFGTITVLLIALLIAAKVSPWPNALLIRYEFNKGGAKMAEEMGKHVPGGINEVANQQYRPDDKDGYLDVFYRNNTTSQQPTVVWVHGGAWVSGDKNTIDNYLKILASYGYTTVGVDYTIAPERTYPYPLHQVNDALAYIQQNAERLHIDPNKIILAGDSAGSQIVAQMATIITNPGYAKDIGIAPTLSADKLKGMLLNCGAYDLALPNYSGPDGFFLHAVLWAYSGKKDFLSDPDLKRASVVNYATKDFPPSFITAGNADPLEQQSLEFAKKLQSLGVSTSTLFYPANHQPALQHEYQFALDGSDAQQALKQMVEFLQQQTR